jgi:hypothetical protein
MHKNCCSLLKQELLWSHKGGSMFIFKCDGRFHSKQFLNFITSLVMMVQCWKYSKPLFNAFVYICKNKYGQLFSKHRNFLYTQSTKYIVILYTPPHALVFFPNLSPNIYASLPHNLAHNSQQLHSLIPSALLHIGWMIKLSLCLINYHAMGTYWGVEV